MSKRQLYCLVLFLLQIHLQYSISFSFKSFWLHDWAVFDLKPLSRLSNSTIDLFINQSSSLIKYDICANTIDSCNNSKSQIIWKGEGFCKVLSEGFDESNTFQLINETNATTGLILSFSKGENVSISSNATKNYEVSFFIFCNPKQKGLKFEFIPQVTNTQPFYNFILESSHGCPLIDFGTKNKLREIIIFSCMILIGVVLMFFGRALFKGMIFSFSFLFVLSVSFLIFYELVVPNGEKEYQFWLYLVLSLFLAIFSSVILYNNTKVFTGLIGASFGYLISRLIYYFIVLAIGNHSLLFYVVIILVLLIVVGCSFKNNEGMCCFFTSLFGSYLLVKGTTYFIEGWTFPDETFIWFILTNYYPLSRLDKFLHLKGYILIGSVILLTIITTIIQVKFKPDETKTKINPGTAVGIGIPSTNEQILLAGYEQLPDNRMSV